MPSIASDLPATSCDAPSAAAPPHEPVAQRPVPQQQHHQQQQQHYHLPPPALYTQSYAGIYGYSPTLPPGSAGPGLGFISASPPAPLTLGPAGLGASANSTHTAAAYAYYTSLSGSPPVGPATLPSPLITASTGHFLSLGNSASPPSRPVVGDAVDSCNVYIRNLAEDCTDAELLRLARPYGDIESSKSIIHEVTGKCKGYGFVKYRTVEQAERAIEAFNAQGLHSSLAMDSFKSKLKRLQDKSSANVYVSNLSTDIDEAALVDLIKPHPVVSA
ncbi:hypothetical protein EV174_003063, partial [Coemansia sp. RSA 2320]